MAYIFEEMDQIFDFNLTVAGLCCERIIDPAIVFIADKAKFLLRVFALGLAICSTAAMCTVYTPVRIVMDIIRCGCNYSIAGCKMGFEAATRVCGKFSSMKTRVAARLRRSATSTTQAEKF